MSDTFGKKGSIARKFIVYILLFSSATTATITLLQLYRDYITDKKAIESGVTQIQKIYSKTLSQGLWNYNYRQVELQLEGIVTIRDVEYAAVEADSRLVAHAGEKVSKSTILYESKLVYHVEQRSYDVGTLLIVTSLDGVYQRLLDKFFFIMLSQAGKTFFVSMFIFYIFFHLVGKHLQKLGIYIHEMRSKHFREQVTLMRNNSGKKDELDMVVDSLNEMRHEIKKDYEKQFLELQKEKEKANKANQAKSQFLSNMSHEIRTPLNSVLGYTQILKQDSDLSNKQYGMIDKISVSGSHLLALINDILDISKIEAGMMELECSNFDLLELLESISVIFERTCENKGLLWSIESPIKQSTIVYGDAVKVKQILINLLGNAVKFTDEGKVSLKVTILSNDKYYFEVSDTGPGIPKKAQEKIFTPFQQEQAGVDKGGTGLGLAISKKQIELMGGTLTIESKEGIGSAFSFAIKLSTPTQDTVKIEESPDIVYFKMPKDKKALALVVDDISDNRDLLTYVLNDIGLDVIEAENGREAVDLIKENKQIDIVFLDIAV